MPDNALQHSGINGSKRRILIVAGDPSRQRFLSDALQAQYDVIYAQTGTEALEMVYESKDLLALVLLDFALPDAQGKAILKQVTEDPLLKSVSVIVMSRDRQDEVYALNNGAMDFILKPCDLTGVVLARVRHVIELSENRSIIRSTERDQLTGLYNKDFFFNYANQYDVYHQDMDMDAMVVNISHFHMINERHGKAYGDDVLRRVGRKILESVSGEGGIVCRRDGDTFLIYCPHRDNYGDILKHATTGMDSRVRLRMGVYPNVDKSLDIERSSGIHVTEPWSQFIQGTGTVNAIQDEAYYQNLRDWKKDLFDERGIAKRSISYIFFADYGSMAFRFADIPDSVDVVNRRLPLWIIDERLGYKPMNKFLFRSSDAHIKVVCCFPFVFNQF